MMFNQSKDQIVFTNRARCRDCYRCIRVCPVGAIGVRDGQAFVDEKKCIFCGTCIKECPQGAKTYRGDLESVIDLIKSGKRAAVSIAPSLASVYSPWQMKRLASALRKLGFGFVAETAVGAYHVAEETACYVKDRPGEKHIMTSCPAVVNYVRSYRQELIEGLVPIVSPMIAHGRMLKKKLGQDWAVVFVGPCVAKKAEARQCGEGAVDYVLTFPELEEWLDREGVDISKLEESRFDEQPQGWARSFPIAGGCMKTGRFELDPVRGDLISVSGPEEMQDVFDSLAEMQGGAVVEPLFCKEGCVNGPAIGGKGKIWSRKTAVIDYAGTEERQETEGKAEISFDCDFSATDVKGEQFDWEQVRAVLEKTGKEKKEDQLNCGACGYSSCVAQAEAVLRGMAEIDMCIPHMRRLAERRTDKIIETSPNGIVILDDDFNIIHMNPSFKRLFMCSDGLYGRKISFLMDPEPFETVASGRREITELTVEHSKYGVTCHQVIYALREEGQFVGVFVNLTNSVLNSRKLDDLKQQTLRQAQGLINHQIDIAGKIAEYLGESTAQSEQLMNNLIKMAQEKPDMKDDKR